MADTKGPLTSSLCSIEDLRPLRPSISSHGKMLCRHRLVLISWSEVGLPLWHVLRGKKLRQSTLPPGERPQELVASLKWIQIAIRRWLKFGWGTTASENKLVKSRQAMIIWATRAGGSQNPSRPNSLVVHEMKRCASPPLFIYNAPTLALACAHVLAAHATAHANPSLLVPYMNVHIAASTYHVVACIPLFLWGIL